MLPSCHFAFSTFCILFLYPSNTIFNLNVWISLANLVSSLDLDHTRYDINHPERPNIGQNYSNQWHFIHQNVPLIIFLSIFTAKIFHFSRRIFEILMILCLGFLFHSTGDFIAWYICDHENHLYMVLIDLFFLSLVVFLAFKRKISDLSGQRTRFSFTFFYIWLSVWIYQIILAGIIFPCCKEDQVDENRQFLYYTFPLAHVWSSLLIYKYSLLWDTDTRPRQSNEIDSYDNNNNPLSIIHNIMIN